MNHTYAVIRCFIRQRILRLYPLPIEVKVIKYPDINFISYGEDEYCRPFHLIKGDCLDIYFDIHTDDGLVFTKRNLTIDYCSKGRDDIKINLKLITMEDFKSRRM